MIFLAIKIIILVLLVIFLVTVIFHFLSIILKGQAPYIMSQRRVIKQAVAAMDDTEVKLAYELGCGDAPFLRELAKKYPQTQGIGVEHSLWPYVTARLLTLFNKNIKIVKKSIYKADLRQADLVYCYLNIATMIQLENKFLAEAKDGMQVVSYNFPLPTIEPYKVLRLKKMPLYFYRLNSHRK